MFLWMEEIMRSFEVKIPKQTNADSRFVSEFVREKFTALSLYTPSSVSAEVNWYEPENNGNAK